MTAAARRVSVLPLMLLSGSLLLGSCTGAERHRARTDVDLDDRSTIVGKVTIDPPVPLPKRTAGLLESQWTTPIGLVYLHLSDRRSDRGPTDHVLEVPIDETFMVEVPRFLRYVVHAELHIATHQSPVNKTQTEERMLLPAPWIIPDRTPGEALYVGTLLVERDEFRRVVGVDVLDEGEGALAELEGELQGGQVRRALLIPPPFVAPPPVRVFD